MRVLVLGSERMIKVGTETSIGAEIPALPDDYHHQGEVEEVDRQQIFPFEREKLVDTQTRISPLEPDDYKGENESFEEEPYDRGDIAHDFVESVPSGNAERHPAAEEHQSGDAGHNEQVQIFGQIEESEVNTGILGVVTGGKLAFCLGKVKRAAVSLGCTGNHVNHKSDDGGHMGRKINQ